MRVLQDISNSQTFIIWGKKIGVPVGPGVGSGFAGFLVGTRLVYGLITTVYLLFERFLNH